MKIKVANLPTWMDSTEVQRHFEHCGEILSSVLLFDANGLSTGTAEILFANESALCAAIVMNGATIHGSVISVELIS